MKRNNLIIIKSEISLKNLKNNIQIRILQIYKYGKLMILIKRKFKMNQLILKILRPTMFLN